MKLARKAGAYGLTLATGMPHPETIKDLGAAARSLISKGTEDVSPETVAALVEGSDEFLRSEEHTSELQSLMRISYAVFCLKKKIHTHKTLHSTSHTYNT